MNQHCAVVKNLNHHDVHEKENFVEVGTGSLEDDHRFDSRLLVYFREYAETNKKVIIIMKQNHSDHHSKYKQQSLKQK